MKLSRIASIFVSGMVLFSIGCGTSSSETSSSNQITGQVIDGPIYNAKVCVDYNFNQECDSDEPQAITDSEGKYTLNNVNLSKIAPVIVLPQFHLEYPTSGVSKAIVLPYKVNDTYDMTTKKVFDKTLAAVVDGSNVVNINPLTTLIGAKLYDLKKEGNLTKETVDDLISDVSNALGVSKNDIFAEDISKNPKLYALSVIIANGLDDNLSDVNKLVDFDTLKNTHSLKDAINNDKLKNLIESLPDNLQAGADEIELAINNAIENDQTINFNNIMYDGLKIFLTQNEFFKQMSFGYPIIFDDNGTVQDVSLDLSNGQIKKINTTYSIDNEGIHIEGEATLNSFTKENNYIYEVKGTDNDGNSFTEEVLVIPKDFINNISNLPGISPIDANEITNKEFILAEAYNKQVKLNFYSNYSCKLENEIFNQTEEGNWTITSNGVVEIKSNKGEAEIVKYDNKYFLFFKDENGNLSGIIVKEVETITNNDNENVNTTTTYPETQYIGKAWGYDWYKLLAFYDGDTRYNGNDVELNNANEYIVLSAYKKEDEDSRAGVATKIESEGFNSDINLVKDGEESYFQALGVSKGINISESLGNVTNTSNLTFIVGLSIRKNKINAWWEIDDPETGNYYDKTVKSKDFNIDLTNLVENGSDIKVEIRKVQDQINYRVYSDYNKSLIFDANLSISDTNVTNLTKFDFAVFRSRVKSDADINESENIINDFNITY